MRERKRTRPQLFSKVSFFVADVMFVFLDELSVLENRVWSIQMMTERPKDHSQYTFVFFFS